MKKKCSHGFSKEENMEVDSQKNEYEEERRSVELSWCTGDPEQETALRGLRISSWKPIEAVNERQICLNCGRKRMYFCYDCRAYIPHVEQLAPKIKLPVKIDIVKHWLERNGKSTALHCKLLAPSSTLIFDSFIDVPDYARDEPDRNTVVVFPSRDAVSIDEFVAQNGPIHRLVVLDATWFTVKRLRNLPQLRALPNVALKRYKTHYWRPQKGFSDEFLATIEAIYYAIRECCEAERKWHQRQHVDNAARSEPESQSGCANASESSQLDDLLFWFYFFRGKVEPEKRKNNK